jgi:histone H3/H4
MIKASEVRKAIKAGGKRCSKDAIEALNHHVETLVGKIIADHNAGKKTIDAALVHYYTGLPKK